MELSSVLTNPMSPSLPTSVPSQADAVLSSDFETFLKMLTAQARFQDPLEPMDSSEYAAQLAQFSMVEQQVLSNDLLSALATQLGSGTMAQMASWIGMDARSTAPVKFEGYPVTILPQTDAGADEAVLLVYDARGTEVQRQMISVGSEPVEWAGVSSDGSPFAPGLYSFKVESRAFGEVIATRDAETYATVVEARRQGDDTVLTLEGGSTIGSDQVQAIRLAGQI
jgi:flagellar basal-body rod modification protein FlgD